MYLTKNNYYYYLENVFRMSCNFNIIKLVTTTLVKQFVIRQNILFDS